VVVSSGLKHSASAAATAKCLFAEGPATKLAATKVSFDFAVAAELPNLVSSTVAVRRSSKVSID